MFIRISLTALLLAGCVACLSLVVTRTDAPAQADSARSSRLMAQSAAPSAALQ